jgi:integrase/recombinase XerD
MMIRVQQDKGDKDRYTLLTKHILDVLREYWRNYRPRDWLFYGHSFERSIASRTVQVIFDRTLHQARIKKLATVHTPRNSFDTHLLEEPGKLI